MKSTYEWSSKYGHASEALIRAVRCLCVRGPDTVVEALARALHSIENGARKTEPGPLLPDAALQARLDAVMALARPSGSGMFEWSLERLTDTERDHIASELSGLAFEAHARYTVGSTYEGM